MTLVENFLKAKGIDYILHEHPGVYTCEEAKKYHGNISGLACKNLFLKGKKSSRYFLVILPAQNRVNLKRIREIVGEKHITFADSEELRGKLGLDSGAVSPFGLLNDRDHEVEVYIERGVYNADGVSFHPNRNTATLELSNAMFHKFLQTIENKIEIMDF